MSVLQTDLNLRQSISGQSLSVQDAIEAKKRSEQAPPPPILIVPPGTMTEDLVTQVERAYKLTYYQEYFIMPIAESDQTEHAMALMDDGLDFVLEHKYRAASDMFSLALILDNNYFFNYLLALVRVRFKDYYQALILLEKALIQIRDKQKINNNLLIVSQKVSFTENFYALYLFVLLQNDKMNFVQNITDFILDQELIKSPFLFLHLIKQLLKKDQKRIAQQLLGVTHKTIKYIADEQLRTHLTEELVNLEKKIKGDYDH